MTSMSSFVLAGTADEIRSYRALKVLAAATFSSTSVSICVREDSEDLTGASHMLAKGMSLTMPKGKGQIAGSSNSMMRTIALFSPESQLLGVTLLDAAQVDSWIKFCWTEIEVPMGALLSGSEVLRNSTDIVKRKIVSAVTKIDYHLQNKIFMLGNAITTADVAICAALMAAVSNNLWDPTFDYGKNQELQNVKKW
eukprot:CAMPEP_0113597392 /NCGR_PEP_ID=MMETSP0015_2-20120614/40979_1 /TAXON_ID=2838 /ORGANISM="Odontella" /LENGTH=195 /DNA_ID=CAMNT_0000505239 /DNA_START=269 /DNA_END=853 /DNA_ORIENTATION=- /assembly_acc=CAM_ASM_000160